jgi:hypothetical protein
MQKFSGRELVFWKVRKDQKGKCSWNQSSHSTAGSCLSAMMRSFLTLSQKKTEEEVL